VVATVACDGGGLHSGGAIRAHDLAVRDNIGPGVYATTDLELVDSTVCDNTGTGIGAGGGTMLTRVTTTCP
jgi:hypothetical protein